jgi:hypothetical protein
MHHAAALLNRRGSADRMVAGAAIKAILRDRRADTGFVRPLLDRCQPFRRASLAQDPEPLGELGTLSPSKRPVEGRLSWKARWKEGNGGAVVDCSPTRRMWYL